MQIELQARLHRKSDAKAARWLQNERKPMQQLQRRKNATNAVKRSETIGVFTTRLKWKLNYDIHPQNPFACDWIFFFGWDLYVYEDNTIWYGNYGSAFLFVWWACLCTVMVPYEPSGNSDWFLKLMLWTHLRCKMSTEANAVAYYFCSTLQIWFLSWIICQKIVFILSKSRFK